MVAFARYFRDGARDVFGRHIAHTLLTHFNLVSALYLGDLLDALRDDGWSITSAGAVYQDDVFRRQPDVLPAGDSLVWACAQETRRGLPKAPMENDAWLEREFAALDAALTSAGIRMSGDYSERHSSPVSNARQSMTATSRGSGATFRRKR